MVEEKTPASASELEQTLESEKTLEFADELTEKGSLFLKESDFAEAVDCFSRALEIRLFIVSSFKFRFLFFILGVEF